jgi:hypothetical protein
VGDTFEVGFASVVQERLTFLPLELSCFSIEPSSPAIGVASDDLGVDEELFPSPRRT